MSAALEAPHSSRALTAYVPRLSIEWLSEHPERKHLAVDGSLAFVDISGFTKLTERLARVGRAGSEEISDLLESTFGALLAATRTDGADLVKWAGDAVFLLFRGSDHAMHAARAAARMREVLRDVGRTHASAGQVRLRMSVGIHSGRFHCFLVGDPSIHRELILTGPAASTTAVMEARANAGQIMVSDATAELLPRTCLGAVVEGGRLLKSAPVLPELAVQEVSGMGVDAGLLLPPPVRAHLLEAAGEPEHRAVAVAFVDFAQTDALVAGDVDTAVAAFDECVRNVQEACLAHGVSFLESDLNRDGGKFMLAAGAPRSSGDDTDRLLRAVRVIVSRQGQIPLRAGVNQGRVFAGDFGPAFRRTYSIKGDAINVAARVMSRADPLTVLATKDVMAHSVTSFGVQSVPPFMVKGKSKPIDAVVLGDPIEEADGVDATSDDVFVGRKEELAALQEAVVRARAGRGSLIDVVAEPGMGKSRLIQEFLRDADDMVIVRGPSASYESQTPYFPFRALVRNILGVPASANAAAAAEILTERVATVAPQLVAWLPLLGIVLGAELEPTRETNELDERFRSAKLEEVLVEFLVFALDTATVVIFENTHLTDDASADLFRRLEASLEPLPWLVLVTRRDIAEGYAPSGQGSGYHSMALAPIDSTDALSLLDASTDAAPLSAEAMEAIAARAGGNPLFLKALVMAAQHTSADGDLPDSIEAVLTTEVDRLPSDARTLLRYASVLGVEFSEPMLREVIAASGDVTIDEDLDRLSGFVQPDGDGSWRFRHALVRHVAYEGLPFRLRRRMHSHAGVVLEASTTNLGEVSERLSLHFFHAADYQRAWRYSRMAAVRAQSQYAHSSAIEFFSRAYEAGRAAGATSTEMAEVLEALGDVRDLSGLSRDAVEAYRRARPYRRDDDMGRAALLLKEAGLHQRLGAFVTSFRQLSYARSILADTEQGVATATRSRLATRYAFGKYLRGDYAGALRWSEVGVDEAQHSGDGEALAYAYNTRHLACIHASVTEDKPYGELALAAYTDIGDLRMQAHCLNNLAIGAMHDSEWDRSAELLDRAADIFRRVGDTANVANAQYNRADLLVRQRRYAEAEPLLYAAERAAWAVDDRELVALATREAGRARAGLGHRDEALERFAVARSIFTELGLDQELIWLDEATADCLVATGDVDRAIALAAAAIARATELDVGSALASLHRVHGYALLAAQRHDEARAAFEAGLNSPDGGDGRRDYALNLLGMAELPQQRDGSTSDQLRYESRQILDTLGVLSDASMG